VVAGRERCLEIILDKLGRLAVGRAFDLDRISTLADLRGTVPLLQQDAHEREVEERLGFGVVDPDDPAANELTGSSRERPHVVGTWSTHLGDKPPERIALLRARGVDPVADRALVADLGELGGELLRIERVEDGTELTRTLQDFDPQLLVVPSALTCAWLESLFGAPLERRLRHLRLLLAENDLTEPIRSRVRIHNAGWIHRGGRLGLPTVLAPPHALVLAVATQIIELLPHGDPEEDGHYTFEERTVLPEQAILGRRYEVVVTSALGYLRLRTGEHVRVVGFDPPTSEARFARPRVVRLAPPPADIRLEGCTVAGPWLAASVRQAFQREDPALVAAEVVPDPLSLEQDATRTGSMRLSADFKDTELSWLTRTGAHRVASRPRALLVRAEVQSKATRGFTMRLSRRIDTSLRRRSPAYAHLREAGQLDPPRVLLMPRGSHQALTVRRVRQLLGPVWTPEVRVAAI
jgi:hypothetical protein